MNTKHQFLSLAVLIACVSGAVAQISITPPAGGTISNLNVTQSATFSNIAPVITSVDSVTFFPETRYSYTGFTPLGRNQYQWTGSQSDNPTRAHSVMAMSVNRSMLGPTSDDGTSTFAQWHIENNYFGPSLATVTSSTTAAGVTTFTVNSTASLLVGKGVWINGHSISGLNAGWQIATIPSGTTFTASTSTSFNGQGGTGGNVYAPGSEIVGTLNTHRLIFGFAATTNADQDNGLQFYAPVQVETPINSVNGPTFQIACTESTSSNNAGGELRLMNRNASSSNFAIRFANLNAGGVDLYLNYDPNKNNSGNFQLTHAGVNVIAGIASGNRIIYGGTLASDDGTNKHQVLNGDLSVGTAGRTVKVKSGSNAKAGTFTLVAGSATVSNTSITANSVVYVTLKTLGGTRAGNPDIVTTASTGFTATGAGTDTSTYNYVILEVN